MNRVAMLEQEDLRALVDDAGVLRHRERGLTPHHPVLRGSAQNPDVFFQSREAVNPFYDAVPAAVQDAMDRLAERTGRAYRLVEYSGHPQADRVIVIMGSGAGAVQETVEELNRRGEHVGVLTVRLFRPFPAAELVAALPLSVSRIAVLDRTKEPGAYGEPLFLDVVATLAEASTNGLRGPAAMPRVTGGRYGLSSKEFTPAMVKGVFDELGSEVPRPRFTVGIIDDVTHLSLRPDRDFELPIPEGDVRAVFYGLGSDGTVGANKNTVKIVSEHSDLHAQGYFVYDSKKAGAMTVSHLRFSRQPIRSTYLIDQADLVACHHFGFLFTQDVLAVAKPGATLLLNAPYPPEEVWDVLPEKVQRAIIDKKLKVHVIDARRVAGDLGLGGRINTVMQPCFFALSGILPQEEALDAVRRAVEKTYGRRGPKVVERNLAAVDASLAELHELRVPATVTSTTPLRDVIPTAAPDFVTRVTARILAGQGDLLPVSALPEDGTFPTDTTRYEKRALAQEIPIWAPGTFASKTFKSMELATPHLLSIQGSPDDCTGCGVCVEQCPASSKSVVGHKSINMEPISEHRDDERANYAFFDTIPLLDRGLLPHDTVKGSQVLQPLFEFSSACEGCGETPYLRLISQLFGDRMIVANATGCSSIYGGNLPTTPWSRNGDGRGPAWSNSLFEDNAEFGLGMRVSLDKQIEFAHELLERLADE